MAFLASILLVFGTLAVFVTNVLLSDRGQLAWGFGQMVHARIPWLFVVALVAGTALGIASLVRRRSVTRLGVVGVEVAATGFLLFLFLSMTALPSHRLTVDVGDPFPAFSLRDQDGALHGNASDGRRTAALFVFYRGDW